MSVTVPVAIPTQIGPPSIIYKTPCGIEPKSPPKPLPKRKPGFREKHIYDRVPLEKSLFQKAYTPVIYPKKPLPTPGKLSPSLLNLLARNLQENSPDKHCEKPALTLPDESVSVTPDEPQSKPTLIVRSEKKSSPVVWDKANRQGCPNLEEQVSLESSLDCPMAGLANDDGDTKQATTPTGSPDSQRKKASSDGETPPLADTKCEELDEGVPSSLEGSLTKDQDTETKSETASLFSPDHRSTTCSASSSCSSSSSSSSSSSASSSSNSSSESSTSSIAKSFFNTPNLGSSTPKRTGSPKNFTPVENLYDSWRLDVSAKPEAGMPPANAEASTKQPKKCSGYYAEISEFAPSAVQESSPSFTAENQAAVLPPPLQFSNNINYAREPVFYVNVPPGQTGLSTLAVSNQPQQDQHVDGVITNDYVDPQDELMDVSPNNTDGSLSLNSKLSITSANQATNQYETPIDIKTTTTQTDLQVCSISCECGEFLCLPPEMEEVVSELKHEQNMRLVSEQLVKMVELEVKELKEDLLAKKTELVQVLEEKQGVQGELREATKIAAQYKVQVVELEKSLARAKEEIAKLEEKMVTDGSSDSGSKEELTDPDFEKKIAEAKDVEAKHRLEVVQTELLASKDEVNRLLAHLAQANREKAEMVSSTVHKELLRMAEERANRAEIKALALEQELRHVMEEREILGSSSANPPKIPPRRSELKYPVSAVGIRTSPKYFLKNSTLYSRGNIPAKRGQPPASNRNGERAAGNKRGKAQNKSWTLSRLKKVEVTKADKEAKNEKVKEVKESGKVSFLQRVQSRVSSAQTKSEVQKSLFNRMQLRFFAKSLKGAVPSSSNCDLPDVASLEEESSKSEYEVPMEPVQRFAGTPLIVGDESAEESDWSSEEEGGSSKRPRNDGGHRRARRNKSRKDRKQKDAKVNEKQKPKSPDDKQESSATPPPSAPVSRLAEVLSSKEGLKSAALKSNAKETSSASDEADGKLSEELKNEKNTDSPSATIIKIKPPPPTAPKPRAKQTSSAQSSDGGEDKTGEAGSKDTAEKGPRVVKASSQGSTDGIFDGLEVTNPKLTSYKRTMGPQGRRLPQRYSNQVQSQRFSNQSANSLAAVSA